MIKLSIKIGKHQLQIEFPTMKAMHKFGAVYGNLPQKCTNPQCGSTNIYLSYKNPKGNDYFTIACGDCKADANFGIHNNETKNLYWKDEKMTVYEAANQPPKTTGQPKDNLEKQVENNIGFADDDEEVAF